MTDPTRFERELTDRMRARADRARVDLDHDRITGGPRSRRAAPGQPTWAVAGAFAAVIALVVAGLALLIRTGDDEPAPADTFPSVLPAPATTVPPPDYGVLDDTEGPTINDHWHIAYGFFLCGQWFQLQGNLEEQDTQGNFVNEAFLATGIHSHDDGVIHVHPYGEAGAGENATLATFLAGYGVELDLNGLFVSPPDQLADVACDDFPQYVVVWPDATNPVDPIIVSSGTADVPLRDGAAITITDTLEGVTPPPWASALPDLAAVDTGQVAPEDLLGAPPTAPAAFGDLVPCGSSLPAAAGLGIEAADIAAIDGGARATMTLTNNTSGPISVGVASFLMALDRDGATASQPPGDGSWLSVDIAAGESLPVTIEAPPAIGSVIGAVTPCSGDPEGAGTDGAYEFVALLDIGGTVAASESFVLAFNASGTVVASSVPSQR